MPNINGTMQGGNRGGLGQDSTYSEIKVSLMLVLLLISTKTRSRDVVVSASRLSHFHLKW
jgi:hypothetical protein